MPPEPKKKPSKRASAKGRQGGEYRPPILVEPQGGPVPTGRTGVQDLARTWSPALHPRDGKGRFRKLGGGDLALAGGSADVRHLTGRKLYALFADLLDEDPPNDRALLLVSTELEAREDAARRRALARKNRMPAKLDNVSDDRLYELWSAHAGDPDAVRRITAEITARQRLAENRDRRDLIDWSTHASDTPAQRRINKSVESGRDLVAAYADAYAVEDIAQAQRLALVDLERRAGESRRNAVRRSYAEFTMLRYLDAEQATRGHLLTADAERAGVDPVTLFSGPSVRARKHASEDLKRWWAEHPRVTYTEFAAQVLTGDRKAVQSIKAQGNDKDFGV